MNGIERARKWYFSTLHPFLEAEFPEVLPRIAAGIAGRGSECFGFDDDISRDHDFGTGVSLWLTCGDEEKYGFKLTRAYQKLYSAEYPSSPRSAAGSIDHGVMRISDFYRRHLGFPHAPETIDEWLSVPESAFAETVNGEVFTDNSGIFTAIREKILNIPEDILRKKLAFRAVMMAQSGQYNFTRCLKHGEKGAAAVALHEFVTHAVPLIFLLNNRFAPYYKWMFRAMRQLPVLGELTDLLESLLVSGLSDKEKSGVIEDICAAVIKEFARRKLSEHPADYLEFHALAITEKIRDRGLREMHIMAV